MDPRFDGGHVPKLGARRRQHPRLRLIFVMVMALLGAGCGDPESSESPPGAVAAPPTYVGTPVCAECHAEAVAAWTGSHHDLAMAAADAGSVLGDFGAEPFVHQGVTTRFSIRDGAYFVTTDGPDGKPAEFPVRYTFGVDPLQQYLLEMPDGKVQSLGVAWDSRPADAGGQRWFHVYGDEPIDHTDVLHWTKPAQNWDTMCADCHSTGLAKRYDIETDRFDTTWQEINVACEACHGPGSAHVAWTREQDADPAKGLTVALRERSGVSWIPDPGTGNSRRSAPRRTAVEIETCAPCHSRRARIDSDPVPGQPYLDAWLPALIQPPLYYPDGQVRDEVYVYGSFLQSRMYQQGVTCSDCHEPHSLQLRAPGAAVCLQCHEANKYQATSHHLHQPGSPGADCIQCHMPPTTFMQVDVRNDHSFRIPRPQLAMDHATPLACAACHADRDAEWAAAALAGRSSAASHWSQRFAAATSGGGGQRDLLLGLAADADTPALIRTSVLARLALAGDPAAVDLVAASAASSDPVLRWGAAQSLATAEPADLARIAPPLLDDPVRAVRLAAVASLAPLGSDLVPTASQPAFQRGVEEYFSVQAISPERADSHVNAGNLHRDLGRFEQAQQAYGTALRLNDEFVPAYVNLADLYRQRGREADAERVLRDGLARVPGQGILHHSLGLSLVRQRRLDEAAEELGRAAGSADATARFALAYGLLLDAAGRTDEATAELERALSLYGDEPSLLAALVTIYQRSGQTERAGEIAGRLPR